MKKRFLLILVIFCVLFAISCNRGRETTQTQEPEVLEEIIFEEVSTIVNPGFALIVNAGLYSQPENDTGQATDITRWVASMALGESVITGETRQMTFSNDNRVYNFIEVKRENGAIGYALALQVAVGGRLGVIVDERAFLYRTARAVDVTGTILSQKSVVVFYPDTESNGFVQVRGYDRERQAYIADNVNFIRLSSISRFEADIQSAILLHTAMSLRENETVRRNALLESALAEYPESVFFHDIDALLNPPPSYSTPSTDEDKP